MLGGINNGLYLISLSGFLIVGVMALILKWAFSNNKSVVERAKKIGNEDEYGLLKALPTPGNYIEAEMALLKLKDSNIKATLTQTLQGPSIMVFERDFSIALAILKS